LLEHAGLIVVVLDQVIHLLAQRMEEDGVGVHVLQEVLPRRLPVLLELDVPVRDVEVQHRVQRMAVSPGALQDISIRLCHSAASSCSSGAGSVCSARNRSRPARTFSSSRLVPNISTWYRWGTAHLRAMMSPAKQWASPKLVFPAPVTPRMCSRLRSALRNLLTYIGPAA